MDFIVRSTRVSTSTIDKIKVSRLLENCELIDLPKHIETKWLLFDAIKEKLNIYGNLNKLKLKIYSNGIIIYISNFSKIQKFNRHEVII
jgi:hypothetical protein